MTRRRGEVAKGPNECENELRENIIRSSMRGGFEDKKWGEEKKQKRVNWRGKEGGEERGSSKMIK
jgi:hypothetical protein